MFGPIISSMCAVPTANATGAAVTLVAIANPSIKPANKASVCRFSCTKRVEK